MTVITATRKLSRFDWSIISVLLLLATLTMLMVWQGEQVGVRILHMQPAPQATTVSTQTAIQITFDQPMVATTGMPLSLSPPISGEVSWQGPTLTFKPSRPLNPKTTYSVNIAAEQLQSQRNRTFNGLQTAWQFTTRAPHLIYMAPNQADYDQLFVVPAAGGPPTQLTDEPFGVKDYAPAPDGRTIAYAAFKEDQTTDLWTLDMQTEARTLLLPCEAALCGDMAWSPEGTRLVYTRRNMIANGQAPGPPRLWWLDVRSGETVAMFQDNQIIGYAANWSPTGEWLCFVSPSNQGVQTYNIATGEGVLIPSRMGEPAAWSPDGESLLVTDIQGDDSGFVVHLLRATPAEGELIDISTEGIRVEDSAPQWSPNGERIALMRKLAGTAMGKQIWVMNADGSDPDYLTDQPDIHHSFPTWSPDGTQLAYQRFSLKELGDMPSIWIMEVATETQRQLVEIGSLPMWLP